MSHRFVATFRVARFSLQAPKLWLIGVAIDRDARHACFRFFSFFMFFFCLRFFSFLFFLIFAFKKINKKTIFFLKTKPQQKNKIFFFKRNIKNQRKTKKEKEASKGRCTPRDGSKKVFFFCRNVTRIRAAIEAKEKNKIWTVKVALRPSGVLLVYNILGVEAEPTNEETPENLPSELRTRGVWKLSGNCFIAGWNIHSFDLCRLPRN